MSAPLHPPLLADSPCRLKREAATLSLILCLLGLFPASLAAQSQSVANSPHNLSISGPGNIHALSEEQVCIFCHAAHHSSPVQPLWNRAMPVGAYTPYRSNSLQAKPDQPTGSSKLCLSCHDGTIALGSVISRQQEITMANGVIRLPAGKSNLGTDLSDDHPISFPYDLTLAGKRPSLKNPQALPPSVKLDANKELQCVSCHDPHNNQYGNFLVMDNSASQLCNACHDQGTTSVTSHTNCSSCHQPHTAPSGPYLLRGATVTTTCNTANCHGTQATQTRLNIASDLVKISKHDTNSPVNQVDHAPDNTVCADCHESHTMGASSAIAAPAISPRLGKIDGVSALGTKVSPAQYEYQVCFKCHGDQATTKVTVKARQITQANKRLQFSSSAVSFHPIEVPGKNSTVPSLRPPWTTTSMMYCTDCHTSSSGPAGGGTGARGPHGSNASPLLVADYVTADGTTESLTAYALCYTCHDRDNLLADRSFPKHNLHIVTARTPCSVCHDSHGIASTPGTTIANSNLINFDTAIVRPLNGTLAYTTTGEGALAGSCTLICHDKPHNNVTYSNGASGAAAQRVLLQRLRPASPAKTRKR